jgi:hypothetical protein
MYNPGSASEVTARGEEKRRKLEAAKLKAAEPEAFLLNA